MTSLEKKSFEIEEVKLLVEGRLKNSLFLKIDKDIFQLAFSIRQFSTREGNEIKRKKRKKKIKKIKKLNLSNKKLMIL